MKDKKEKASNETKKKKTEKKIKNKVQRYEKKFFMGKCLQKLICAFIQTVIYYMKFETMLSVQSKFDLIW